MGAAASREGRLVDVTEEMVEAFEDAGTLRGYGGQMEDVRAGLAAVLAIVERDYVVLCGAVRPVSEDGIGALTCNGRLGHDPEHRHLDGDWLVTWP